MAEKKKKANEEKPQILVPTEATLEALNELEKGDAPSFDSIDALLKDLNGGDDIPKSTEKPLYQEKLLAEMNTQRMTWEEIKERYPHRQVGLTDVVWVNNDNTNIESAIVKCTDADMSLDEMADLIIKGILQTIAYTTPEDESEVGTLTGE